MIIKKSPDERKVMQQGGQILAVTFDQIKPYLKEGITTLEIDKIIEEYIISRGAKPGFKTVQGYHHSSCISINNQVVHTPPSNRKLVKSDIVTIDIGVLYQNMHTDKSRTFQIKPRSQPVTDFLSCGRKTLDKAIAVSVPGNYIWDISKTIETEIEMAGYKVIHELTGHGVGRTLHEDPLIPGFATGKRTKSRLICQGMTLAIEVIYSMSSNHITVEKNSDWSLITADNSLSACFEDTIYIDKNKPLILT